MAAGKEMVPLFLLFIARREDCNQSKWSLQQPSENRKEMFRNDPSDIQEYFKASSVM